MFLSWCISSTNKDKTLAIIPQASSYEEIKVFFEAQNKSYKGGYSCRPYVGFLILYDENYDNLIDMVAIISEVYDNGTMKVVYGNKDTEMVECKIESKGNPDIVGYCAPEYLYNRVENNSGFELNALDTVSPITNEEYVKIIAENNIEVIARYVNPEGRTPLSLEEVKLL